MNPHHKPTSIRHICVVKTVFVPRAMQCNANPKTPLTNPNVKNNVSDFHSKISQENLSSHITTTCPTSFVSHTEVTVEILSTTTSTFLSTILLTVCLCLSLHLSRYTYSYYTILVYIYFILLYCYCYCYNVIYYSIFSQKQLLSILQ